MMVLMQSICSELSSSISSFPVLFSLFLSFQLLSYSFFSSSHEITFSAEDSAEFEIQRLEGLQYIKDWQ